MRDLVRKIAVEVKIVRTLHGASLKPFGKDSLKRINSARRERVDNPEDLSAFFLFHLQFQFSGKEISFLQAFAFGNDIKCHPVQIMIKIPASFEVAGTENKVLLILFLKDDFFDASFRFDHQKRSAQQQENCKDNFFSHIFMIPYYKAD